MPDNGEQKAIEQPAPPPYAFLQCAIKGHGFSYLFRVPPEAMDAVIDGWVKARKGDDVMLLNLGAEGTWHIPANDILFWKRITEAEAEAIQSAARRAQMAMGTAGNIPGLFGR